MTAISDATGITSRTYDELNRVKTKAVPSIGTSTYTYDIMQICKMDTLQKQQAITCVMRRMINIIFSMLKNKTEYRVSA